MKPKGLLISYHHDDKKLVDRLGQLLAERGLEIHSTAETGLVTPDQAQAMAICLGPFWLWRQHLNILMSGWERGETDEKALLQGVELVEAEEWLAKRRDSFDSEGRVYIWQSLAHRNGEQDRRWLVGIGLTVLLILGIAVILIQEMSYLLI